MKTDYLTHSEGSIRDQLHLLCTTTPKRKNICTIWKVKNIYPSILYKHLVGFRVTEVLELIPAVIRQEAGYALDRSLVHHGARQRQTTMHSHIQGQYIHLTQPNLHDCKLWEEARAPGKAPYMQHWTMHSPFRNIKLKLNMNPKYFRFCLIDWISFVKYGCKGVLKCLRVWGYISDLRKGHFHICDGGINAGKCIKVSEQHVRCQQIPCILKHDNWKPYLSHIKGCNWGRGGLQCWSVSNRESV